ncbi:MAG: P-type conjugative transfer ATPase TrbB [Hyphomonadaceae bacterium]|nr:P-type conjugative transfer ATPase TrbB [Hyphomonadaceae bacterium]
MTMQALPLAAARRRSALERSLGPAVADALARGDVVEAMINADGALWLDVVGEGLISTDVVLSAADREAAIRLIAHEAGEVVGEANPSLAAILPGSLARVQAVLPPLSAAPLIAIRKRPSRRFSLDDYVADSIATPAQAEALRNAVAARRNIIVAGGTGSGKTTLLNALLAESCFRDARVVILEDTAELQCSSLNAVLLLTRRAAPAVTMRDLVQMTLRLRPDRIVVGEVRDGAALEVLKAWNTGHPGGLLSLHANSAADALARLEDLCVEAVGAAPRRMIAGAVDMIVFIARTANGRRITEISHVEGREGGLYRFARPPPDG